MKKIFAIAFALLCFSAANTQLPGSPANAKSGQQALATMGHVYGKIVDSSGKPLSEVSVLLLQNKFDTLSKKRKEILLKGISTKGNGEFSFSELPIFDQLKLKISAMGYTTNEQTVSFQLKMDIAPQQKGNNADPAQAMTAMSSALNAFDKDLGNIKLSVDSKQLQSVTVTASKSTLRMDIDKKVFSVDKNIVSAGGTALDIMKNVPSVQVDIDGNVSVRNAPPQLYLEGRPTTLTLDQIPADAVESVEVITNPSAKFDASGGNAGILNIILKKNKKSGYNGNIRAGADKYGAVNGGGDLNIRQDKFNFSAAINGNQMKSKTTGTTDRLNFADMPNTQVNQITKNTTNGGFVFGRLGLDYFLTNRTTLSAGFIKVHGEFSPAESIGISTDTLYSSGATKSFNERTTTGKRNFNANGIQLGMKQLFPREGEELTADLNFFSGKNSGNSVYNTDYFANINGSKTGNLLQKVLNNGTNQFLTIQTDYVLPLKKNKSKIETGLRTQLRKLSNDNNNYIFNNSTNTFDLIQNATSNYKNNDNVYASYISFSSMITNFGYKIGLRAESSEYNGVLTNTNQKFSNRYPVSLFPSVFLSQKLKNKQEVQFSYTRRVNRPNFFQLIPFTDYTDPLNITKGNSNLVPEFTNSLEASYTKTFKGNNTLLASVYYKKSTDLITRYQDKQFDAVIGAEVLINTYINANSGRTVGAEFTSTNTINKWWDMTSNINLYNSKINTDNITGQSQDALWSWFGKLNNNFKLPKDFSVQLSAVYQSKTNLPVNQNTGFGPPTMQSQSASQGYIKSSYGVDLAVKKSFLKNNVASATLSFNDIFRTRRQQQYSYSDYFQQNYDRLRDPQMIRFTLTYRFGKMDMSLFKRKNLKGDGGMQGATEGIQQ